uniref:Uncharacterized protein n=1 Tax=Dulem virus 60 TaxID=3145771 RepID=A0AAU8B606_9VIRU
MQNQHEIETAFKNGLQAHYGKGFKGFSAFLKDSSKYGVGAVLGLMLMQNASAAVTKPDVAAVAADVLTDGSAALGSIGGVLIALAGIAVVFKWAKAAFFG